MELPISHTPVLVRNVVEFLKVVAGEIVVDATVGVGGHSRWLGESLGVQGRLIGIDLDEKNLEHAKARLAGLPCRVDLIQGNFAEVKAILTSLGIDRIDVLFADLGVNSTQLDDPARGFSFQHDGPLDMRMDSRLSRTAADLVNRLSDRELGDLIFHNSQEPGARRIARVICERRREQRITTTRQLARIVADALGVQDEFSRKSKTHPATRTFQALRMAVNGEAENLRGLLDLAPGILKTGGRFGVIAFHSVEDRAVKQDFRQRRLENVYDLPESKPIVADEAEREQNPRSRSAKFRVAVRRPVG